MNRFQIILLTFLLASALSSCDSYKKLTYMQDIAITGDDSLLQKHRKPYRLQPGDILYIRVITQDEEINKIFNPLLGGERGSQNMRAGSGNIYFNGYTVNDSGYIEMPILDSIYVDDLTMPAAKNRIVGRAKRFLKEPQIIVKLSATRFTLMGEVNSKGVKEVYDEQVNIMEALAYGGGITYNGDREHVLLIRPTGEGSHTYEIDVTDKSLISSERYYIQPNDIVYVPPLRTTLFRERTTDYMFMLSTFSSVISTVVLILNLTR